MHIVLLIGLVTFCLACTDLTNQTTSSITTISTSEDLTTMPTTTQTISTTIDPKSEYESFYVNDTSEAYPEDLSSGIFKASFGYQSMFVQGYNNWYYNVDSGSGFSNLSFDSVNNRWGEEDSFISGALQHTINGAKVAKTFSVPSSGEAVITGNVRNADITGSDATFYIAKNGIKIYPADQETLVIPSGNEHGFYFDFKMSVSAGDNIQFVVSVGTISVNPTIVYNDFIETSIYFDFENEFFENSYPKHVGDVHPFYHEGKMYMYYLETNGRYSVALLESNNMLLYTEKTLSRISPMPTIDSYYVLGISKYQDKFITYYGASASNIYSSQSEDLYNWAGHNSGDIPKINNTSGRDPFVFYDPDIDRYRIIFVSYYNRDTSVDGDFDAALWLLTSEANTPDSWEDEHIELLRFDNAGASGREDPEVSQMAKIGNRWYLISSIYSRTAHGVGRLSYWKGEENTLITDVSWQDKTEQFIDGEDICAAQLVQVGEKWYMFGWVPNNANSSYWGGALSIAREVYQLENGDLATRLDPYMTDLLNQGQIYDMSSNGITTIYGSAEVSDSQALLQNGTETRYGFDSFSEAKLPNTYNRVIIDFVLSIPEGENKAGILLKNSDTATRHFIYINRDDSTLYIYSRTPEGYFIRSSIQIQLESFDDIKIKIIVDGSIVDVFVNDTYSLCARITNKGNFELDDVNISLFTSGSAEFTELQISKLACKENIFD